MMYRLIILNEPQQGTQVTLATQPMTLGRAADCAIVIPDEEVAQRHAVIEHRDDSLFIRDLGSMNKILVNQREVAETRLKHGDVIELGRTRMLVQARVLAEVAVAEARAERKRRARNVLRILVYGVAVLAALLAARGCRSAPPARPAPAPAPAVTNAPPPAPVPAVTNVPPAPPPIPPEILTTLKRLEDTVQQLASNRPPAVVTNDVAAETQRLQEVRILQLMTEARTALSANQLDLAERKLAAVVELAPDFLPAIEQRAGLLEKIGRPDAAIAEWSRLIARRPEKSLLECAVAERERLRAQQAAPPPPPVAAPTHARIQSVEVRKLPPDDAFDEQRLLTIRLHPAVAPDQAPPDRLRLEIRFFEEDADGRVAPSRAMEQPLRMKPGGAWGADGACSVSAAYRLPRGFREQEARAGRPSVFHGYEVKLWYEDALQDEWKRPLPGRTSEP